jgi:hypothetical protein
MTKKHFEVIAYAIRVSINTTVKDDSSAAALRVVIRNVTSELARTNPRFNRARFLEACGAEIVGA